MWCCVVVCVVWLCGVMSCWRVVVNMWLCWWCVCGVCECVECGTAWCAEIPRAHVQHASVCSFKTPPCVAGRRPHVFNMRASCCFTRRRFETTHGGVLDMSTGGGGGALSLSLPFCPCFFLYFVLFLLLLFFSLLFSLPPPSLSLLFSLPPPSYFFSSLFFSLPFSPINTV